MKRIHSLEELQEIAKKERAKGSIIVFTNGCFDVIHAAHVRLLSKAKDMGDILILALNSDNSIRELKGDGRPIYNECDRITVLSELQSIDYIYVFDTMRCHDVILAVLPHKYVKGKGWTPDSLDKDEHDALDYAGAEIYIIDNNDENSSDVIKRIQKFIGN